MYKSGIYKITNTVNNKCYIGSTIDIIRRWKLHKTQLKHNRHHSILLQRSYTKHGIDSFKYSVILYCSVEDLIIYEQKIIDLYKPEYNICSIAGSLLGIKRSEETKQKMSVANKGKIRTEEQKKRMSEASKGNKHHLGHRHSEETKQKMSESHKKNFG